MHLSSYPPSRDPHHVRKEGFSVGSLQEEELWDVHDVALGEPQLPLQHLAVPVDAFLGEREAVGQCRGI